MEEAGGEETELGGRAQPRSSPDRSSQQESEQLGGMQLSSKAGTDLSPPLIAIKKGKGENNGKYLVTFYGEKSKNKV